MDLTVPTDAELLVPRANVGGGVCVLCRVCADHGLEHACITRPGAIDTVLIELPRREVEPLLARLAAHPARPLTEQRERRGVDRTWCVCGCLAPKAI